MFIIYDFVQIVNGEISLIQHCSCYFLCWSDDISVICNLYHFCFAMIGKDWESLDKSENCKVGTETNVNIVQRESDVNQVSYHLLF